jgi:hypothetical protein
MEKNFKKQDTNARKEKNLKKKSELTVFLNLMLLNQSDGKLAHK